MISSLRCSRLLAMTAATLAVTAACANEAPHARPMRSSTTSTATTVVDVERAGREATFRVRNRTCFGAGDGTGFLIDARTLITNRHVVEGALELEVETWDGKVHAIRIASQSVRSDLAVLDLERSLPVTAIARADRELKPGDEVTVLGYPLGGRYKSSSGPVVGFVPGAELGQPFTDVLSMDLDVKPGNSGGPVLDVDGRLVAVVYAIDLRTDQALAVPVSELDPLLDGQFTEPVRSCLDD